MDHQLLIVNQFMNYFFHSPQILMYQTVPDSKIDFPRQFVCFVRDLLICFCVILYRKDTVGGLKARHQTTNNKRVILNERLQTRILNERPQMKDAKRIDFEQNPK